jgi:hypothetical protein
VLAYDYPLLGIFWTTLWIFLWVAWIFLLFRIIADIFRDRDMGGVAKAVWCIFILFLPFLGAFVYLIARGTGMAERDMAQAAANERAFRSYVQDAAGSSGSGSADQLAKLADLRDRGVIDQAEFDAEKAKILG